MNKQTCGVENGTEKEETVFEDILEEFEEVLGYKKADL
jgi:hypothetical protein